jgi:hypothetical protein
MDIPLIKSIIQFFYFSIINLQKLIDKVYKEYLIL